MTNVLLSRFEFLNSTKFILIEIILQTKYWIKDYIFNANIFKGMTKPGHWKIEAAFIENDAIKCGIVIYGKVDEIAE